MHTEENPTELGIGELTKETLATTAQLFDRQLALVRAELMDSLVHIERRVILFGASILAAGVALSVLVVSAGIALGRSSGHSALVLGCIGGAFFALGCVLFIVALKRQLGAFARTRDTVTQEITWAKQTYAEMKSTTSPEKSSDSATALNP